MSFSYASTNAASSALSFVRLRVGDTSSGSYRLEDEEIEALISAFGNKYLAAAAAADNIAATFSQTAMTKKVGRLSISGGERAKHYMDIAKRLRMEAASFAGVYAGGISKDDVQDVEDDTDRVEPRFSVGQFDNPGVLVEGST